jgi:hypothetical protein
LTAAKEETDTKIAALDKTIAQIARDVTTLSDAQRKSQADYVQIKEQMLTIVKDSSDMKHEMMEMKSMIMSIAEHLGGVRSDNTPHSQHDDDQSTVSQLTQSHQHSASINQTQSDDSNTMSDIEETVLIDEKIALDSIADSRKKSKQSHTQVFDTQATPTLTPPRANHPNLTQHALVSSDGSDKNLPISEEDIASMCD